MPLQPSTIDLRALIRDLSQIIAEVEKRELAYQDLLKKVQPHYYESARNLLHYLALRTFNLRAIQSQLSTLAISSIGHSEGYTLTNLHNILLMLRLLNGEPVKNPLEQMVRPLHYRRSREQITENTARLLGECTRENCTKIMVTFATDCAYDYDLVYQLIHAGMDVARINTAHDTPEQWQRMAENVRRASAELGKPCAVYMDLAGPKLRTLAIDPAHKIRDKKGGHINLYPGNRIKVYRHMPDPFPVPLAWTTGEEGENVGPAAISTTLPQMLDDVRVGERIFFDDGQIGGVVSASESDFFMVDIKHAGITGTKLRTDKGINLPDTVLNLPSLADEDYANLPFIARYADIVGYSFVRRPEDVELLQQELQRLNRPDMGIVLKIETKSSFEHLPMLLLTAMRSPKVGVMIARGDLAVEVGFERIAEVQEEILWLCEAAHIPGIWATQVLEKLAKSGLATRAEITDAAMSARAECVMLNKGPYIESAVATLHDIIHRMEKHQFKRKSNLRPLSVASRFLEGKASEVVHL